MRTASTPDNGVLLKSDFGVFEKPSANASCDFENRSRARVTTDFYRFANRYYALWAAFS